MARNTITAILLLVLLAGAIIPSASATTYYYNNGDAKLIVKDRSGGTTHGYPTGYFNRTTDGKYNGSASFTTGALSYVYTPGGNVLEDLTSFTWAFWVKIEALPCGSCTYIMVHRTISTTGTDHNRIDLSSGGNLRYFRTIAGTSTSCSTTTPPFAGAGNLGVWKHVLVEYDSVTGTKMFVDNVDVTSVGCNALTGTLDAHCGANGCKPLTLGGPASDLGTSRCACKMDELRFYTVNGWTSAQRALIANGTPTNTDPRSNLALWYTFDEVESEPSPNVVLSASASNRTVNVTATGTSSPNGHSMTYYWNWGDGTSNSTGISATHTYALPGTYTVTLAVAEADTGYVVGATGTAVIDPPYPVALFTIGKDERTYYFVATPSYSFAGYTLSYAWQYGDSATGTGESVSHTYANDGLYTVNLTITETQSGRTAVRSAVVNLTSPNPFAAFAITSTTAPREYYYNATSSYSPNSYAITFAWQFGDSSTSTSIAPYHTYSLPGTYPVNLTVTETTTGHWHRVHTNLTVNPQWPFASYTAAKGNRNYTLNASSSVSFGGYNLTYAWDYGDGTTATGSPVTRVYEAPGRYDITLTVTETETGRQATRTATYLVQDANTTTILEEGASIAKFYPDGDEFTARAPYTRWLIVRGEDSVDRVQIDADGDGTYEVDEMDNFAEYQKTWTTAGTHRVVLAAHDGDDVERRDIFFTIISSDVPDLITQSECGDICTGSWKRDDGGNIPNIDVPRVSAIRQYIVYFVTASVLMILAALALIRKL